MEPIPDKFRREMPLSARKAPTSLLPPSERNYTSIKQSSFYGSSKMRSPSNVTSPNSIISCASINSSTEGHSKLDQMVNGSAKASDKANCLMSPKTTSQNCDAGADVSEKSSRDTTAFGRYN